MFWLAVSAAHGGCAISKYKVSIGETVALIGRYVTYCAENHTACRLPASFVWPVGPYPMGAAGAAYSMDHTKNTNTMFGYSLNAKVWQSLAIEGHPIFPMRTGGRERPSLPRAPRIAA